MLSGAKSGKLVWGEYEPRTIDFVHLTPARMAPIRTNKIQELVGNGYPCHNAGLGYAELAVFDASGARVPDAVRRGGGQYELPENAGFHLPTGGWRLSAIDLVRILTSFHPTVSPAIPRIFPPELIPWFTAGPPLSFDIKSGSAGGRSFKVIDHNGEVTGGTGYGSVWFENEAPNVYALAAVMNMAGTGEYNLWAVGEPALAAFLEMNHDGHLDGVNHFAAWESAAEGI